MMPKTFFDDPRTLKIKDFIITDEFETVDIDEGLKNSIKRLIAMNCGVLLVREGEEGIIGVITERKILKAICDTDEPFTLKAKDLMDTHILKIHYNEKLSIALDMIETQRPAAVVVINKEGEFKGYFSPIDFSQAQKMFKDFKKRLKVHDPPKRSDDHENGEETDHEGPAD